MSLTKEVAHDIRPINTQPTEQNVLPSWAKLIPVAFYAGLLFFVSMWAFNNFRMGILDAQEKDLNKALSEAQQMITRDRSTIHRLVVLHNMTVRVARWVDYNPMMQPILKGIFAPLDQRLQISALKIQRNDAITPEYTMALVFRSEQNEADPLVSAMRQSLSEYKWLATSNSQNYQEGATDLQAYLQPAPGSMRFESQYVSLADDPTAVADGQPTGVAQ